MLKLFNFNLETKSFAIIGLKASTSIIIFATLFYRLLNPYLWLDESVQFWVSQGLSPFAAPNSYRSGAGMVLEQNRLNNLDPGGFSLILHYWVSVSTDYRWLRFLPTIFFLGGLLTFFKLLKKLNVGDFWIYFTAIIFVFGPSVSLKTSEVRAYSMEFFGIGLTLLAAHSVFRSANGKNILFFLFSGIFTMTSRYDGIIFYLSLLPFIIIHILNGNLHFTKKPIYNSILTIFSFSAIAVIYFNQTVFQNSSLKAPGYLRTISNNPTLIFEKISLGYLLILSSIIYAAKKQKEWQSFEFKKLILRSLIASNLVLVILSTLGKLPWAPLSPQNFSVYVPTILLMIILTSRNLLEVERLKVRTLIFFAAMMFFVFTSQHFHTLKVLPVLDPYVNVLRNVEKVESKSFLVDCSEVPSIRYLIEFGALHQQFAGTYPKNFELRGSNTCSENRVFDANLDFEIVIPGSRIISYDLVNYNSLTKNQRLWISKVN